MWQLAPSGGLANIQDTQRRKSLLQPMLLGYLLAHSNSNIPTYTFPLFVVSERALSVVGDVYNIAKPK